MVATGRVGPPMLAHDFPLRPDLMIRLVLPVGLTEADAERVCGFVRSLVFPADVDTITAPQPLPVGDWSRRDHQG